MKKHRFVLTPGVTLIHEAGLHKAFADGEPITERRWLFTAEFLEDVGDEFAQRLLTPMVHKTFAYIVEARWEDHKGIVGATSPLDLDHSTFTVSGVLRREEPDD